MADPGPFVADLRAESDDLDALVAHLPADRWADPTPAPGWTIAHQIGHLLWTDRVALTAVTDEAGFAELMTAAAANPAGFVDDAATELAAVSPAELLTDWRVTRGRLHEELLAVPDGRKLAWFGPPMSAASMATARLMETWAHGLDVADALGVIRPATQRLRSIAHLGVRTRDYAFIVNNLTPPAEPFLVELRGPSGDTWSWGPSDAAQRVTGSAEDFCFLVTQRRALSTLDVNAVGEDAQRWLTIALPPGFLRRSPSPPRSARRYACIHRGRTEQECARWGGPCRKRDWRRSSPCHRLPSMMLPRLRDAARSCCSHIAADVRRFWAISAWLSACCW